MHSRNFRPAECRVWESLSCGVPMARTAFVPKPGYKFIVSDFSAIEESILTSYFNDIRPQMVQILSEDSVLSPEAAEQTAASLKVIQEMLQYQKEDVCICYKENGDLVLAQDVGNGKTPRFDYAKLLNLPDVGYDGGCGY